MNDNLSSIVEDKRSILRLLPLPNCRLTLHQLSASCMMDAVHELEALDMIKILVDTKKIRRTTDLERKWFKGQGIKEQGKRILMDLDQAPGHRLAASRYGGGMISAINQLLHDRDDVVMVDGNYIVWLVDKVVES